jgi:hypothetical protein
MTSVGAVIVERIGRTSIRNIASSVAQAIPGLALIRSIVTSGRTGETDCIAHLSVAPVAGRV